MGDSEFIEWVEGSTSSANGASRKLRSNAAPQPTLCASKRNLCGAPLAGITGSNFPSVMTHAREALFIAVGSFIAVAVMVVSMAIEPSGKSFGTNALRPPLALQAQTGTDGAQADTPEWDVVVYPPEASANVFDVSPYVGAYAFCKNTPGSAQPKAIVDAGTVSFLFYKSSNEEMHQFLAKMQELPEETSDGSPAAIDPVSLWNGKFYYSKAYIVQNPDGAQYGEAPTVEDGFMYYIAAVPSEAGAKIHFSCATGLTPSDAVPRCGN